jgi:hypothetical protein
MLGSGPVFDRPTQLYQRLISGDHEEALASARDESAASVAAFYDRSAVPMLALAARADSASPAQRHRVLAGSARLLQMLQERHRPEAPPAGPRVLCVGARNELDLLSAQMLAHALQLQGRAAEALSAVSVTPDQLATLDLAGVGSVVLCSFNEAPQAQARLLARRLRRRCGGLRVVLAAWQAGPELRWPGAAEALGVDALAVSLLEAAGRAPAEAAARPAPANDAVPTAGPPAEDGGTAEADQQALHERLARGAQRAAEVFGTPRASVCWQAADGGLQQAGAHAASWALGGAVPAALPGTPLAWVLEHGQALLLADVARDPRFAGAPGLEAGGALAALPLRGRGGNTLGVLALHDTRVRHFDAAEQRLLATMAAELAAALEQGLQAEQARLAEARGRMAGTAGPSASSYSPQGPLPAAGAPCAA